MESRLTRLRQRSDNGDVGAQIELIFKLYFELGSKYEVKNLIHKWQ